MAIKKLLTLLLLICFTNIVKADWPVGKKRMILTPSLTYFNSNRLFDSTGRIRSSANGDQFSYTTLGIYGVTGITRSLDFVFNVPISNFVTKNIYVKESKTGVGDVMFGLAYHTPSKDLKKFFTLKGMLIVPVYSNLRTPYMGYGSKGILLGANYSFSPKKGSFFIGEANYTRYFDDEDGPNQYALNLTYGKELNNGYMVSYAFNHISSVSDNKTFSTNLNINKDFMVGKVSAAIGKKISRNVTPYFQAFYLIYGRNSGQGFGITFMLNIKIP